MVYACNLRVELGRRWLIEHKLKVLHDKVSTNARQVPTSTRGLS
jgi:hypothetical protein